MTDDRRQKTDDRRQKTDDRRQKTDDRRQKTTVHHHFRPSAVFGHPSLKPETRNALRILPFDLEEWFQLLDYGPARKEYQWEGFPVRIEQNLERIRSLLISRNLTATFFTLGWIARKYPILIKQLAENGNEIAWHSNDHKLLYESNPVAFRQDIRYGKALLEDLTGKPVKSYRSPGFSLVESTSWAFPILAEEGFEVDSSVFPARRNHGGMITFPYHTPCRIDVGGAYIKEFPVNTFFFAGYPFVFSGGGYFRFWPYIIIKRCTLQSAYIMSYFHPRDFDSGQPLLKGLSPVRRYMSYTGLKSAMNKLKTWTNDFQFMDLKTANEMIHWDEMPVVKR